MLEIAACRCVVSLISVAAGTMADMCTSQQNVLVESVRAAARSSAAQLARRSPGSWDGHFENSWPAAKHGPLGQVSLLR